jgi:hypothetical protein
MSSCRSTGGATLSLGGAFAGCRAAPENEPVSTTWTSTCIVVKRFMHSSKEYTLLRRPASRIPSNRPSNHRNEPNESIMTFDSRSAALQPVDLVASQPAFRTGRRSCRGTTYRSAAAMLAFVAGLLLAAVAGLTRRRGPRGLPSEPAWTVPACNRLRTSSCRPISQTLAPDRDS